jgi:hypothetical protein
LKPTPPDSANASLPIDWTSNAKTTAWKLAKPAQ